MPQKFFSTSLNDRSTACARYPLQIQTKVNFLIPNSKLLLEKYTTKVFIQKI
ncbi:MAG: hypothetical protein JWQ41_1176 [Variovorax sp.]|nr:hypothetical protein [Variovorax sp.]